MGQWLVIPTPQYMDDRAKYEDDPRLLKELARVERQLSREGISAFKEAHRVDDVWTVYVSQGRRLLVKAVGEHLQLVGVGEHDDVYRDHTRRGGVPLNVPYSVVFESASESVDESSQAFLFERLSDDFLVQLGVLAADLSVVRSFVTEDDMWSSAASLGESLTLRLSYCLTRAPAQVLDEYLTQGRDEEALELAGEVESALESERLAHADTRAEADLAHGEAERAHLEAAKAQELLQHQEAELERVSAELSAFRSASSVAPEDIRLNRLEAEMAKLEERVAEAHQRVTQTQETARRISRATSRAIRTTSQGVQPPAGVVIPGSLWLGPRGQERWRLSPTARSMTRLSDGATLASMIGTHHAEQRVRSFLSVRPEGGRVWVDQAGHAVTLIRGALVYLGELTSADTKLKAPEGTSLGAALWRAVAGAPGSTARELAFELRRAGYPDVSRSVINSLLYSDRASFARDDSDVPRWRVTGGPRRTADSPPAARMPSNAPRHARSNASRGTYEALIQATSPRVSPPAQVTPNAVEWTTPVLDLLPWQREAMERWYAHGCRGIVEAVTGTGKTHLGLEAAAQAHSEGRKSTVLVPSVDLQDQWVERFTTFLPGMRLATIGGSSSGDPRSADVIVAVVNSALTRDLTHFGPDPLLVADEVHRYGAEQFQYALRARYAGRLGLTATLERSDDAVDEVLNPYFGGSILTVDFNRAIREDVVAPFQLIMAPIRLGEDEQQAYDTLSKQISNGLKTLRNAGALKDGPPLAQQLGQLRAMPGHVGAAARTAESSMRARRRLLASLEGKLDAIEELSELVEQSQGTVIFTQSKDMAEDAALRLREWGITASALYGEMPKRDRKESLDGLTSGRVQALAAPQLLDEGIDVPTVDLGIVMTASRSRRQMVQRLGRIIRRKSDQRTVRFVLLYAQGSVEDPGSGVHEGFFDLVGDVARNKLQLQPGWTADDLM